MDEAKYQKLLNQVEGAKTKAKEAFVRAEKAEADIKHQMEVEHIKINNKVDNLSRDVGSHRKVLVTVATVIGLTVLGALLKVAIPPV